MKQQYKKMFLALIISIVYLACSGIVFAAAKKPVFIKVPLAYPSGLPGLGISIKYLAEKAPLISDGSVNFKIYEPKKLLPPFEMLGAVDKKVVEACYGVSGYWSVKVGNALNFFLSVPYMKWSDVVLIGLILLTVFAIYVLKLRTIEMGEHQWHFYAVGFMIGLSYAVTTDSHMGMDLVRDRLSKRKQIWLDILGIIFLLLPFVCIVFYQSLEFVHDSWMVNERSNNDMGLPFRWVIKSLMPISFMLLIVSALSRLMRDFSALSVKDLTNGS